MIPKIADYGFIRPDPKKREIFGPSCPLSAEVCWLQRFVSAA
jgi:hypothetical protein